MLTDCYAQFVQRLHTPAFEQNKNRIPPEALIDFGLSGIISEAFECEGAKKALMYGKADKNWDHSDRHHRNNPPLTYNAVTLGLLHGILGVCGEAGELAALLVNALENDRDVDVEKLTYEAGDVLWYLQLIGSTLAQLKGRRPEDGLPMLIEANISKLTQRYGEELIWSSEKAIAQKEGLA